MIEVETVRELLKGITPGGWLTENRPGQNGFVYTLNTDGVNRMSAGIAAGKVDGGERAPEAESHANARLIAAAPDLAALALAQAAGIARLREALEGLVELNENPPAPDQRGILANIAWTKARAALVGVAPGA